jgi:hypothetical protein
MAESPPPRIPGLLSRDQFLALVGLEVEAFNSSRRRGQLPLRPPYELPDEVADARGWSPFAALALLIALDLVDRYDLSRMRAAQIAGRSIAVQKRWPDVCRTSEQLAESREPDFHILFGSLDIPSLKPNKKSPDPTVAIGTLSDISARYPSATRIIAVSVTRCAALMRQRAVRAEVDLTHFFEQSPRLGSEDEQDTFTSSPMTLSFTSRPTATCAWSRRTQISTPRDVRL